MPRKSNPNRCTADECVDVSGGPPCKKPARRKSDPAGAPKETRLIDGDVKTSIFEAMHRWRQNGSKREESPIADLVERYGVSRFYPDRVYKKVMNNPGTGFANKWGAGRPPVFDADVWNAVDDTIREMRGNQKPASASVIQSKLKGKFKKVPKPRTIRKYKKVEGFKYYPIKTKPKLSFSLMAQRKTAAQKLRNRCFKRVVVIDEKMFSEEKGTNRGFEARPGSPVDKTIRFKGQEAETATQRLKTSFLAAATGTKKIGIYNLTGWKAFNLDEAKRNGKKAATQITGNYISSFLSQVYDDARRVLGPGRIDLQLDKAPCHIKKEVKAMLEGKFDEVWYQPGKSPDFNMMDAAIFPWMERAVEAAAAHTVDEINATVEACWEQLDEDMLPKVADRVRRNATTSLALEGGNFYDE